MNKIISIILGVVIATTLFVWSPSMGQSNDTMLVNAQHQVPITISFELPSNSTETNSVQFTLLLDIASTTALRGSDAISTSINIDAEVISEIFSASVDIGSALESNATVITPTSVQLPSRLATVNRTSNIRECPSTSCDIVGLARAGQEVDIVGQNEDGSWYQLVSGEWIAALLVNNATQTLPQVETSTPDPEAGVVEPRIDFIEVPSYGTSDKLEGQIQGAEPEEYNVAVYIYVSGWWTKPKFDSALTPIRSNGRWTIDITTDGDDHLATQIAAFLVPVGYTPPRMSGEEALSQDLFDNAVAYIVEERDIPEASKPTATSSPTRMAVSSPASAWITVTAAGGEAWGEVGPSSVCNTNYKVALYAKTDIWYVQPFADSQRNIEIEENCVWRSSIHPWNEIVAFLVPAGYEHPSTIREFSCPPLDPETDSKILAADCVR